MGATSPIPLWSTNEVHCRCYRTDLKEELIACISGVSREHFKISHNEKGFFLQDLGSTTGTFSYIKPDSFVKLSAGLMLKMGTTEVNRTCYCLSRSQNLTKTADRMMRSLKLLPWTRLPLRCSGRRAPLLPQPWYRCVLMTALLRLAVALVASRSSWRILWYPVLIAGE